MNCAFKHSIRLNVNPLDVINMDGMVQLKDSLPLSSSSSWFYQSCFLYILIWAFIIQIQSLIHFRLFFCLQMGSYNVRGHCILIKQSCFPRAGSCAVLIKSERGTLLLAPCHRVRRESASAVKRSQSHKHILTDCQGCLKSVHFTQGWQEDVTASFKGPCPGKS